MVPPTTALVLDDPTSQIIVSIRTVTDINLFNIAYPLQIRWSEGDSSAKSASPTTDTNTEATNPAVGTGTGDGDGDERNQVLTVVLTIVGICLAIPSAVVAWKKLRRR